MDLHIERKKVRQRNFHASNEKIKEDPKRVSSLLRIILLQKMNQNEFTWKWRRKCSVPSISFFPYITSRSCVKETRWWKKRTLSSHLLQSLLFEEKEKRVKVKSKDDDKGTSSSEPCCTFFFINNSYTIFAFCIKNEKINSIGCHCCREQTEDGKFSLNLLLSLCIIYSCLMSWTSNTIKGRSSSFLMSRKRSKDISDD